MSGAVPRGAHVDAKGNPTEARRAFDQSVYEATGGPYEIRLERVDDTNVRIRMKGADGTWRASSNITLS
jgi:hypothetical protein